MIASRNLKALSAVVLFSAAALAGWTMGQGSHRDASPALQKSSSTRPSKLPGSSDPLRQIQAHQSEEDRIRSAIAMANALPSSEISAWLKQGKLSLSEGYALTVFQQIAFERWSREEPAAFLAWVQKNGGGSFGPQLAALFTKHPDVLTEAFAHSKNSAERGKLLSLVTSADPRQALAELRKLLPFPGDQSSELNRALQSLTKALPAELEALLKEFPGKRANPLAKAVFQFKLSQDFDQTFDELLTRHDGFDLFYPGYGVPNLTKAEQLLPRLADFPESWRARLLKDPSILTWQLVSHKGAIDLDWEGFGFSEKQSQRMRRFIFNNLSDKQAEAVFNRLDQYELTPEVRHELIKRSLTYKRTPEEIAALGKILQSPEDQAIFQEALEAKRKSDSLANLTPQGLIDKLDNIEGVNISSLFYTWKPEQKEELASNFQTLESKEKSRLAALIVGEDYRLPVELEGAAIIQLLNNPDSHELEGWSKENHREATTIVSNHAHRLFIEDSENASRWVSGLPEGPTRLWAKINLATNWKNLDPDSAQRWIDSQPEAERKAINERIDGR